MKGTGDTRSAEKTPKAVALKMSRLEKDKT